MTGATSKSSKGSSHTPRDAGKGKSPAKDQHKAQDAEDEAMEEDDDDDDEEEDEEAMDEDEEEEEDDYAEIDPSAIQSRRTRGKKVDYTSPEALAKAGLKPEAEDEDDE